MLSSCRRSQGHSAGHTYSLFANTLHPAIKCSTVSFCWPYSMHLLHSASTLEAFHDLLSTICSRIFFTEAVFLGVRFFLSHKLQLSSCFRDMLLCICFSRYSSFCSSQRLSLTLPLLLSMLAPTFFNPFSIRQNAIIFQFYYCPHCIHLCDGFVFLL